MTKSKVKKVKATREESQEKIKPEIKEMDSKVEAKEESRAQPKENEKPKRKLAGYEDEEGARYLDEIDLLRWQNSVLRIKNLRHQVDALRHQAENIRLTMEAQRSKCLSTAGAFEVSAKNREKNQHINLVKEMGARYGVDFTDKNVVLDDETGKISFINPPP